MTTVTSSVIPFKSAFATQLRARAGLYDVQIERGTPSGTPSPDLLIIGDVTLDEDSLVLGNSRRDERYTTEVTVSCVRSGTDQDSVSLRAAAIMDEVLSELRTNPRMNDTVFWALPRGRVITEPSDNERVEGRIVLQVECRART